MKKVSYVFPFIIFFLLGIVLFFLESILIDFIVKNMGIVSQDVNIFNKIFFIAISFGFFIFWIFPKSKKISILRYRLVYLGLSIGSLYLICVYWIQMITWKF